MQFNQWKRREFITLLGGAAVWSFVAWAQQPIGRVRRIVALMGWAKDDPRPAGYVKAFEQRLRELGWTIGGNLRIDYFWATGDPTRMHTAAAAALALAPDLIVASTTPP